MKNLASDHKSEIAIYQPNHSVHLEVLMENDTVWLTQAQMVYLFDSSKANISEHIKHIYETQELDMFSTVRNFRTVRIEGKREVSRNLEYYNLDMIIAIGYRVNTKRGLGSCELDTWCWFEFLEKHLVVSELFCNFVEN